MPRGRKTLILALFILLTATVSASLSVKPSVVNYEDNQDTFSVTITNPGPGPSGAIWFMLEQADGTDPLTIQGTPQNVTPDTFTATVKQRGSDSENDAIHFTNDSLGDGESLTFQVTLNLNGRGSRVVNANFSGNDKTASTTLYVDDSPPEAKEPNPTAGNVTDPTPRISLNYSDGDGIGVDTGKIVVRLNGRNVPHSNIETLTGSHLAFTPAKQNLSEGKNNISIRLVDRFGNSRWRNWSFGLAEQPLILGTEPTGLVRNDMPKIKAVLEDPSGIDFSKTWIGLDGRRYSRNADAVTVNAFSGDTISYGIVLEPTGFLDDGVHQARVHAVDTKGNARTATWNFTTDVTPPSISFVSVTGDQEIYKETMGIFIEASDATSGVEEVVFEIAGQTDTVTTRTDGQFRGAIDTTKLPDGRRTLNITVRDRAGNIVWETRSFIVDNTAPSITDATIFPDPTNVAPELTVRARDASTSVVTAEYFIGSDPGKGEAVPLQVAENIDGGKRFHTTISIEQLDDGEHTVHVRVKDTAQHWSDTRDITFRLDRDLQASITFEDISRSRVRQGSTTRLTVPVTNTGKVPAHVNLSVNTGLQSTVSPASLSIDPGETRSFRVSLSAKEQRRIGNYSLRLSALASTTRATTTSTVTVTADRATQQRFEARVSNLSSQLEQLQQRRERWRRQLQDSQLQNITALLRTAEKDMQAVQTAIQEGNYRRVSRKLPVIETRLQRASNALETGIKDFKQSRRTRNIILATIALIIIVAVTAAYRMMPPPEGYGEGGFIHRPEGKHPARARGEDIARNLKERLEELIRRLAAQIETYRGTEEEEEGWTGYDPS